MDSEMELAPRCPAEIPCQFNRKRAENSVQKGTAPQAQREYVHSVSVLWPEHLAPLMDRDPLIELLTLGMICRTILGPQKRLRKRCKRLTAMQISCLDMRRR